MSFNTRLDQEDKISFLKSHLQPLIVSKWKKIQHEKPQLFMLLQAIHKLEYYDKELCDLVLNTLKDRKSFARGLQLIQVYEILCNIKSSGKFYRDLSADITFWKDRLKAKDSVAWRYDVENMKWYTYQELKAERDNYKFPDQVLKTYTRELTEEERLKKEAEEKEKEIERQEQEREKRMNDIVKERYQLIMRGDMSTALSEFDEEGEDEVDEIDMEYNSDDEEVAQERSKEENKKLQKQKLSQDKKFRKAMLKTGAEKSKKEEDDTPTQEDER